VVVVADREAGTWTAAVVPWSGASVDPERCQAAIAARHGAAVATFSAVVPLHRVPLTEQGKPDRVAIRELRHRARREQNRLAIVLREMGTGSVRSRWAYLYRSIDRDGNLVNMVLSEHRDMAAAQAFFHSAKVAIGTTPKQELWFSGALLSSLRRTPRLPPPCTRHNQHVSANRRRLLHLRRATSALAILEAP
jgi:hypothetical protein